MDFAADLNFDGYLMISGSASELNPDAHFIKSIKVFDPLQTEKQSIYDYEAERDTEEYVRITSGSKATKDIIHEKAPVEQMSDSDLKTSLNALLRNIRPKF